MLPSVDLGGRRIIKKIYLSGVAGSGLICEDFYYKLLRAGADVYYEKDAHTNLSRISHIGKNDLLIAITYGAKTKEVLESFNYAKIKGASLISISKNENSKLAKDSDVFIKIPSSEKEIRYGAIASLSLIHISEPTRREWLSRMPSSA